MYVLIHKNRVCAGPRDWSKAMFDHTLSELKIDFKGVPTNAPNDGSSFVIDEDTKISGCQLVRLSFNPKLEYLDGPFWDFSDNNVAVGTYQPVAKPIDLIKLDLKDLASSERYRKETAGVKVLINGSEISVSTERSIRNEFNSKLTSMGDLDTVNWKFNSGWLSLTKADVALIVNTINQHVQSTFDWEFTINQQIDQASTPEELEAIEIV